jgi:zinc and cadmium transporter
VITAAAVLVHEVPEEVADYVLLRKAGMSRGRALGAMTGVQLTAAIGAVITLVGVSASRVVTSVALAVAAGTFLHIAEVDLDPDLPRSAPRRTSSSVGPRRALRRNSPRSRRIGLVILVPSSTPTSADDYRLAASAGRS